MDANSIRKESIEIDTTYHNKDLDEEKAVDVNNTKDYSGFSHVILKEGFNDDDSVEKEGNESKTSHSTTSNQCLICTEYQRKISVLQDDDTKVEEFTTLFSDYQTHQVTHSLPSEKKFSCNDCSEKFTWSSQLRKHKLLVHGCHECKLCHRQFVQIGGLKSHKRHRHKVFDTYSCKICSEEFFVYRNLLRHAKIHKEEKTCPKCNKKLESKLKGEKHKCVIVKVHECKVCKKSYAEKSELVIHMEKDHGVIIRALLKTEKTYQCDVCSKFYKDLKSLSSHKLTHYSTNRCDVCGKCFTSPNLLDDHISVHESGGLVIVLDNISDIN